jgi:hypothetical protein
VKDGHAWKIFTRSGDEIIILTCATDTWIGVKAGNYWIAIHTCSLSFSSEERAMILLLILITIYVIVNNNNSLYSDQ